MPSSFNYIREPAAIYARSFELVREATDLSNVPECLHPVVIRLVHACGMPDIVNDLAWTHDIATEAAGALRCGGPILADCEMVANGVIRGRLPAQNDVVCTLNNDEVPGIAVAQSTTRSAAAIDLWRPHLEGAVVAIGNAPTALFRLLEVVAETGLRPAAICGFPVGFVGAAESKTALQAHHNGIPFITLHGQRGGSALAAAAVNALAGL
ncbi:MAG: precorrin-8X methylmutase [Gammaproteobacteria bacterium]|nr:precorrin-8X methylmutase [Gammaproteobacteria bacterium]